MALDMIEIDTTGEPNIYYDVTSVSAGTVIRSDTARTIAEPRLLEIGHQPGSATKPDRHMVKFTITEQDSNDESRFATGSVHVVFTVPRSIVTIAQMKELWDKMEALLSPTTVENLLKGQFL